MLHFVNNLYVLKEMAGGGAGWQSQLIAPKVINITPVAAFQRRRHRYGEAR
jgi:hypothetical protein